MSYLAVLSNTIVVVVGFVSLSIAVLGTVKSRISSYWFLVLFNGLFTVDTVIVLIREYLLLNEAYLPFLPIYLTYAAHIVLAPTALLAAILYVNHTCELSFISRRDAAAIVVAGIAVGGYFLPQAVRVDATVLIFRFGLPALVSQSVYLLMLIYIVVAGLLSMRYDRTSREQVLFSAFVLFGATGLVEVVGGVTAALTYRSVAIAPGAGGHLISSFAYLIFAAVMIYYFGTYLISESRHPRPVEPGFAERFALSSRERDVVELLNRGLSNREIAEKLNVSLSTVKTHLHHIYDKTGVAGRFELYHLQRGDTA